ncbi:MAG: hypothetical protein IPO03_20990 [Bacteroidetes bacterium]|nr:hypothetical protein [Bacteroidota bacterium]
MISHASQKSFNNQHHDPFGMLLVGRNWEGGSEYRFGFNRYENTNEILGGNIAIDFGARVYDSRLGRFFSIDPRSGEYPWQTPYAYFSNSPIKTVDIKEEGGGDPLKWPNYGGPGDPLGSWSNNKGYALSADKGGRIVETFYDETAELLWSVMHYPNDEKYYYLAEIGAPNILKIWNENIYDNHGNREVYWQEFIPRTAAECGDAVADGLTKLIFGIGTLPLTMMVAPELGVTSIIGRSLINFGLDASIQMYSNGFDYNNINVTQLIASTVLHNSSLGSLVGRNLIGNVFKYTLSTDYVGVFSESYYSDAKAWAYEAAVSTGIGVICDYSVAKLAGLNSNVTTQNWTRWRNLSYKPKYNSLYQNYLRNQTVSEIFSTATLQISVGTGAEYISSRLSISSGN